MFLNVILLLRVNEEIRLFVCLLVLSIAREKKTLNSLDVPNSMMVIIFLRRGCE